MIQREKAWKFAHEWLDAWNKHDVDLIMKHYARNILLTLINELNLNVVTN